MKIWVLLVAFCCTAQGVNFAQTSPYLTWVTGSDLINQPANYGTLGVPGAANGPGARENAISWTDAANNLWLFGGHGYGSGSTQGYLNDLWKFDQVAGQWTWISGDSSLNEHGIYGSLGVASSTNLPGARQNGYAWTDSEGDLWLFGGFGFGATGAPAYLNDLWKYDVALNQWAWMSGSNATGQAGDYGTLGTSAPTNIPGARYGGNAWFAADKLWLFGGQGFSTVQERYNDLWSYDVLTGMWTWITGSDLADQNGTYGTMGVPSASGVPGARQASANWVDDNEVFWLYGGYGFPQTGTHDYLSDLWKYDYINNRWTWVSGVTVVNQPATYGTPDIGSVTNSPGARQMSITGMGNSNDLWLFGAWGHCGFTGGASFGRLNDLWRYEIATNAWTWIAGSNTPDEAGLYGSLGVADLAAIPGARRMGVSWTDTTGVIWLFGGNGYDKNGNLGLLNDLWKIEVSQSAGLADQDKNAFRISPTVFIDWVKVAFDDEVPHAVEVRDLSGRIILTQVISGTGTIDLTSVSSGAYVVCTGDSCQKIIKTN